MKIITTINLDEKSRQILDDACKQLGVNRSMVIRWLLNNFFVENKTLNKK